MNYRMADFEALEKESVFVPFSGISSEKLMGLNDMKVFAAYAATMYKQHGVWIQPFTNLDLAANDKIIYFHSSNYIPYCRNQNYSIDVVSGLYLVDYLRSMEEGTVVMISVKDEGSQQIDEQVAESLQALGIDNFNKSHLRHSYLWVACKKDGSAFEVLHEECSPANLKWEGILCGKNVILHSGGALGGNSSSILIDGEEWSSNQRGLNIVTISSAGEMNSINFDTFATLYAQGSLFRATPHRIVHSVSFAAVSQAGGQIRGVKYTNCKEAFEQSYAIRGHRIFEVDLELTSDGELVARHDWDLYLYRHLQQEAPEGIQDGTPLTLEQFKKLNILTNLTPMTITDLFQFLVDHPDSYLITDTKYLQAATVEKQFKKLVDAAAAFGYKVLLRIIPQLYSEEMYDVIERVFPFPRYIYTLYQTGASDEEVLAFVRDRKISFVTTYPERYSAAFGAELNKCGAKVFIHTINSLTTVRELIRMNVTGFYTDVLSTYDIQLEITGYQVELNTRKQLLREYLNVRFDIHYEEYVDVFETLGLDELCELGEQLFKIQSEEEAITVLRSCQEISYTMN